jgi:hypothetical protein
VWLTQHGINKLVDISSWDASGNWRSWVFPRIPEHLQNQNNLLLVALTGLAPVHLLSTEKWGWGKTRIYTAVQGFTSLQSHQVSIQSTSIWKQVWDPLGLPKVNFFFWVLMHKKVLTGENLIKRGIIGPHRCSLCCNALETMDHLFVDCPFAQEVWNLFLHDLNVTAPTQITVVTLFSSWKARYPHVVQSKSIWNRIWQAIPKYLCWKIWLARNDRSSTTLCTLLRWWPPKKNLSSLKQWHITPSRTKILSSLKKRNG